MSTTHGQPGLSSDQRSTIRSTILSTRRTLEEELRRQLEKYGIYEDKKLPQDKLTHLSAEELHTRNRIDAAIERELESTEGDLERSITNYVREATKTHLNRFVGLKTIEVRGFIEETITKHPEFGNRSYMHHTVAEITGELTNVPDDGFGAALDLAYQEIGAEIRMIFEESEHTTIDLDAQVREEVLDELDAIDDEAWESDEALGWVYQYFGEKEREEIDERVEEENYKIAGTDIATKTQLFTPRYIVEWMVDNSLGRMWLEMKGGRTDINEKKNCFYLTPSKESLIDREGKPVEEITVLDPACGSGHMLFYAFDVLYQMYLEEGKVPEKYIPRKILQNNLFGIDIDSGAAQIAALSLYLKAKKRSPDINIPQLNIVSADAVLINGERKKEVLGRSQSDLEKEILRQIWNSFENIRELGSLVQIEDRIDDVLSEYRDEFETAGQAQFTSDGDLTTQSTFVSGGEEETWGEVKNRLMQNVQKLAREALEHNDPIEEMFAAEVEKTVELLDVLRDDYDIVVTNPPYLASAKMGENLNKFISERYIGKLDSYGAFIQRSWQFAKEEGYCSLVTPENYMFIGSFTKLRKKLVENKTFIKGMHLSGHGFDMGDRPFTIPFIFRNSPPTTDFQSIFYRITHKQSNYDTYEKKIEGLSEIILKERAGQEHNDSHSIRQESIYDLPRYTFAYWFDHEILELFTKYPRLGKISNISGGVASGDNAHHLRKHWEVPSESIGEKYHWHIKGGESNAYYDAIDFLIRWENGGQNIIDYGDKHGKNYQGLSDISEYFKEGIAFRNFSNQFMAKYYPDDCVYDKSVYSVYPNDVSLKYTLGYLNSNLFRYIANGINPTVNFNPSDAGEIPIPSDLSNDSKIEDFVTSCISAQQRKFSYEETTRSFNQENFKDIDDLQTWVKEALYDRVRSKAEVLEYHSKIDNIFYKEMELSEKTIKTLNSQYQTDYTNYTESPSERTAKNIADELAEGSNLATVADQYECKPTVVSKIQYEKGAYPQDDVSNMISMFVSYLLGVMVDRWQIDDLETGETGIVPIKSNTEADVEGLFDDVLNRVTDKDNQSDYIQQILGQAPTNWLDSKFFRHYHCKEYRRRGQRIPIYWQLKSPNGAFSCFIYYHEINKNTLPKLRGQYIDPRIDELKNELETLNAQTNGDDPNKELLNRKEHVQNNLDEIREFRDTIDEMIDDGVTVDVEEGIWENIKEWDQYEVLETGLPKLKSSYSR